MFDKINVAAINPESIVDGPGVRMTVYLSGCKHDCPGCHNKEAQSFDYGEQYTYNQLFDTIVMTVVNNPLLGGITLSGGDPLYQPELVGKLVEDIKNYFKGDISIWIYTGFNFEDYFKDMTPSKELILKNTEVIVDGEFVEAEKDYSQAFRGSHNQRFILTQEYLQTGQIKEWQDLI